MNKKADNTDVIVQNPLINSSVEKMILVIRDKQVLLDRDLATLYGVETRAINQAVKRNQERFPERNCFMLNKDEIPESLKSQVVTLDESSNALQRKLYIVFSLNKSSIVISCCATLLLAPSATPYVVIIVGTMAYLVFVLARNSSALSRM